MTKNIKSEALAIKRFFEKLEQNANFVRYFSKVAGKPNVASPSQGVSDPFLKKLANKIKPHRFPFAVLDFGCGEGRLLAALLSNHRLPLSNVHYVGVDRDENRLETARIYAEESGAESVLGSVGFCTDVELVHVVLRNYSSLLLPPKLKRMLAHWVFRFHYIFAVNVLHELSLVELPYLLERLIFLLAKGGTLHIQELPVLPEAEGRFIPWNRDGLRALFSCGHSIFSRSRSGCREKPKIQFRSELLLRNWVPVIHAKVTKLVEDYDFVSQWELRDNIDTRVIPLMKGKANRELKLRESPAVVFLYYTLALQTITEESELMQIIQQTERLRSSGGTIPCPNCRQDGAKVYYKAYGPAQIDVTDERIWSVRCKKCGYEGFHTWERGRKREVANLSFLFKDLLGGD